MDTAERRREGQMLLQQQSDNSRRLVDPQTQGNIAMELPRPGQNEVMHSMMQVQNG